MKALFFICFFMPCLTSAQTWTTKQLSEKLRTTDSTAKALAAVVKKQGDTITVLQYNLNLYYATAEFWKSGTLDSMTVLRYQVKQLSDSVAYYRKELATYDTVFIGRGLRYSTKTLSTQ